MIKNRAASLTLIIFIYVLAAFCGLFTYNYLTDIYSFSYQAALFIADVLATVLVFIFSLIFKNASVYDPYWSVQPPVILGLASVLALGGQWWLLTGALVNTLMFLFISIPMADKRQSRKPGFAEYKKATRML